jgi:hypothetical protein
VIRANDVDSNSGDRFVPGGDFGITHIPTSAVGSYPHYMETSSSIFDAERTTWILTHDCLVLVRAKLVDRKGALGVGRGATPSFALKLVVAGRRFGEEGAEVRGVGEGKTFAKVLNEETEGRREVSQILFPAEGETGLQSNLDEDDGCVSFSFKIRPGATSTSAGGKHFQFVVTPTDPGTRSAHPGLTVYTHPVKFVSKVTTPGAKDEYWVENSTSGAVSRFTSARKRRRGGGGGGGGGGRSSTSESGGSDW